MSMNGTLLVRDPVFLVEYSHGYKPLSVYVLSCKCEDVLLFVSSNCIVLKLGLGWEHSPSIDLQQNSSSTEII